MVETESLLLVLENGRIRDALDTLAVTQALVRSQPSLAVDVLAPRPAADLLLRDGSVRSAGMLEDVRHDLRNSLKAGDWPIVLGLYRSEQVRAALVEWAEAGRGRTVVHPHPERASAPQELVMGLLDELAEGGIVERKHIAAPVLAPPPETAVRKAGGLWREARPRMLVICECETALITELNPSPIDEVRAALNEAFNGLALRMVTRLATSGTAWIGNRQRPIPVDEACAVISAADLVVIVGSRVHATDDDLARLTAALGVPMIALPAPSRWARYVPTPSHRAPVRELEHLTLGTPTGIRPDELVGMAVRLAGAALTPARTPNPRKSAEPPPERAGRGRRRAGDGAVERPSALRKARKVLVVRPDSMGDVILAGPAIRTLRANLPNAHLSLLCSPAGAQAAELLPWLDDVVVHETVWQDLGEMPQEPPREWSFIKDLAGRDFEAAVILTSFGQTPQPAALIAALAGVPLRIGEGKEDGDELLTLPIQPTPDALHHAERNLRLMAEAGLTPAGWELEIAVPAQADEAAAAILVEHDLPSHGFVLMSPWSSSVARDYPPSRMIEAGASISAFSGGPAILVGRSGDRRGQKLPPLPEGVADLVDRTSVPELAALVRRAGLVLTVNSLTMHLADALNTPCVVLHSGAEYVSQGNPRSCPHRVLWRPAGCRPCYRAASAYHQECADIPAGEIVRAADDLLADVARSGSGAAAPARA